MALEQAGVELVVKGFNKYIKELDAIDKKQQEVFSFQSKGVDESFNRAAKSADKYEKELKQLNKTQKKVQAAQKQTSQSFSAFASGAIALATGATARFIFESAKLAASFQGQQAALQNLAASFGQSGSEIQASIQAASRGTLSGLQAINVANEALLLGVAKTPEEFDKFTRAALVLGRTVGLSATESISRFTTALGRESLLRLDDFGNKAAEVNAVIEELAQTKFGKLATDLSTAEKSAIFIEAALTVSGEKASIIGEEAGSAVEAFERLNAQAENLQVTLGEVFRPGAAGTAGFLSDLATAAQQSLAILGAGLAGVTSVVSQSIDLLVVKIGELGPAVQRTLAKATFDVASIVFGKDIATAGLIVGASLSRGVAEGVKDTDPSKTIDDIFAEAGRVVEARFKEIARTIEGVSFPGDEIEKGLDDVGKAAKDNTEEIKALGQALKRAEQLAISFARAQEDAVIKSGREVAKLERKQAKNRDKLLKEQAKELDAFEKNRLKEISSTEKDIAKERASAARERVNEQRKLQQQLRQAQERFNLSQIQSERQFQLQETRLRAEGDILALQQLREDKNLQQLEEKENFDLSQRQAKEDGKEQQRIQADNLDERLRELKVELEDQRAELLAGFDNQLVELQNSQQEQRAELQRNLVEQEADRQLSQQRQLEDLGRSFAQQEAITEEGATAIANELEGIFGIDGTASTIISGFTAQTESEFTGLFEKLEEIVSQTDLAIPESIVPAITGESRRGRGSRGRGRFAGSFQDGGVVSGGPIGTPQLAVVHTGETIIPAQQTISAPVIPSQNLNVEMSGGFNITGGEQAGQAVVEASISEMTDVLEIAVKRLARRGAASG